MHLLLPLLASVLLVCGLLLIKRAGGSGVGPITTLFFSNIFSALVFTPMWFLGGVNQPASMLWQPGIIAVLFFLGLTFTFLAVERGDVSIATPVLGVKVVLVAVLVTLITKTQLGLSVWCGAVLAMLGIALIQWTGRADKSRMWFTIAFALLAASSFATFDVLVQSWAPAWGPGRFLPITYAMVGAFSLALAPWVNWAALKDQRVRRLLFPGSLLVALQAVCIVFTLAAFGDAARVNVVYSMRGIWAVGLAWAAAKLWGGAEAELSRSMLTTRVLGAITLTVAVVIVILGSN